MEIGEQSVEWLRTATQGDSPTTVARRAGVTTSTLTRQLARGGLSGEVIVAVARAYGAPVLDGLVAAGMITEAEAGLRERLDPMIALRAASDADLAREILRRAELGDSPILTNDLMIE